MILEIFGLSSLVLRIINVIELNNVVVFLFGKVSIICFIIIRILL